MWFIKQTVQMNGCSFQQVYSKIWVGFCLNIGKRFLTNVSFKNQQKEHKFYQKTVLGIYNMALCFRDRSTRFYVTISGDFERFQYFNFEKRFLENEILFQKIGVPFFWLKAPRLKTHHSMYKELIWCTNDSNVYIHTFCKRWSFIWGCFNPVKTLTVLLFICSKLSLLWVSLYSLILIYAQN